MSLSLRVHVDIGLTLGVVQAVGFGQMYNDVYPSLWYHVECGNCLKHPLLCLCLPHQSSRPQLPLIFLLFLQFYLF